MKNNSRLILTLILVIVNSLIAYGDGWNNNLAHHETLYADVLTSKDDVDLVTVSDPDGFEVFTNAFFATSGVGNVGIGTTGPNGKLEVSGGVSGVLMRLSGYTNARRWDLNMDSAGLGMLFNGATEALKIAENGNVGIGTTNPLRKLVVQLDTMGTTNTAFYNADTTNGNSVVQSFRTDTIGVGATPFLEVAAIASTTTEHDHATRNTNLDLWTESAITGMTSKLTILGNGNVGIGTANPTLKLSVIGPADSGIINSESVNGYRIVLRPDKSSVGDIYAAKNGAIGTQLSFSTQSPSGVVTERLRIDSNGKVGIGATSPIRLLQLEGSPSAEIQFNDTDDDIAWHIGPNSARGVFEITETGVANYVSIQSTTGKVGIGDRTPNGFLEVSASGGTTDLFMLSSDDANDGDLLIVKNDGNVGIGTTGPTYPLTVKGTSAGAQDIFAVIADDDGAVGLISKDASDHGSLSVYDGSGNEDIKLYTAGDSWLIGGNVGIGTTSPARKLHISDAMRLQPIASPPASPSQGDLYFDTSDALCVYVTAGWSKIAGAGTCA